MIKLLVVLAMVATFLSPIVSTRVLADDPAIAGPVFRRVARNAVEKVKTGNADIANLTQAFFYALSRG